MAQGSRDEERTKALPAGSKQNGRASGRKFPKIHKTFQKGGSQNEKTGSDQHER